MRNTNRPNTSNITTIPNIEHGSLRRRDCNKIDEYSRDSISSSNKPKAINTKIDQLSSLRLSSSTTPLCDNLQSTVQINTNSISTTSPSSIKKSNHQITRKMQYIHHENTNFFSLKNMSLYREKFKSIQRNTPISHFNKNKSRHHHHTNQSTLDYQYKLYLNKILSKNKNINFSKLVIIDWDDTLFPTSAVSRQQLIAFDANPLFYGETKNLYYNLKQLIDIICKLFNTITKQENGKIIIVTNAGFGWIDGIFNGYFSGVVGRLFDKLSLNIQENNIEIRSARDEYLERYPKCNKFTFDGKIAKTLCMKSVLTQYCNNGCNDNAIPIIYCIGDGMDEFNASRIAWNDIIAKKYISILQRIKFIDKPSLEMLMQELQTIESLISDDSDQQFIQWIIDEKYVIDYV